MSGDPRRHYPYSHLINLNDVEKLANMDFLPVTLPRQLGFSSVTQVKEYVKQSTRKEDEDDNPILMMSVLMEAFFGHYSTCLLDHKDLTTMFAKLINACVDRIYHQGIVTVPEEMRQDVTVYEPHIEAWEAKLIKEVNESTPPGEGRNQMMEKVTADVKNIHRSKVDIEVLVSKFTFKMASRFYVVPVHLIRQPQPFVSRYIALRNNMIAKWIELTPYVVSCVNPEIWFSSMDPKSHAIKTFPPNAQYDMDELNDKKNRFTEWFNREKRHRVAMAEETDNEGYAKVIQQEFDEAAQYADLLYKALIPRAKKISQLEREICRGEDWDYDEDGSSYVTRVGRRLDLADVSVLSDVEREHARATLPIRHTPVTSFT